MSIFGPKVGFHVVRLNDDGSVDDFGDHQAPCVPAAGDQWMQKKVLHVVDHRTFYPCDPTNPAEVGVEIFIRKVDR